MTDRARAWTFPPETLRQYALIADGERGGLVGPRGEIAFLCAPRWHDDAVFSGLLGGAGMYAVTPDDPRFVWGGHYEPGSLIWRSRWVTSAGVIECQEAMALPADERRAVLLRRVVAVEGPARVRVALDLRAGFGSHPMQVDGRERESWHGCSGPMTFRWSGAPAELRIDGGLSFDLDLPAGQAHDLVLEITDAGRLPAPEPAARLWEQTERAWAVRRLRGDSTVAPSDVEHSHAVLVGLTSGSGATVAAATTALPERADRGRNYDYRYAWIRDQCYVGRAAAAVGATDLFDSAVRFVTARVLEDGERLRPAYTVTGQVPPAERDVGLPGYPGAPVRVGNWVRDQFQLDTYGEALLLLSTADRIAGLDPDGRRAVEVLVKAVANRWQEPDAGIWELQPRRWAHSRLMCAAGLRAVSRRPMLVPAGTGLPDPDHLSRCADALVASAAQDSLHPRGRWQRAPDDDRVDGALLLPGLRGAVPPSDPRHLATIAAVDADLSDDGHLYRFRHDDRPLDQAEGAFVLLGFVMAMVLQDQGDEATALRWF